MNVALNEMKGNLGSTLSEVGWVIAAYSIGNVIIVPMTSWLSQQFGRRNYFAASIVIFTIFSFLCGNANNIWELVFFRPFILMVRQKKGGRTIDISEAMH